MASEKQIAANQRNAQCSTGPVTPEGKAAASQNALKHGLRAGEVVFARTDEQMQDVRDALAAEWQPQTFTEWTILDQLAVAFHQHACYLELEAEWESRINNHQFPPALQIIWRRLAALERTSRKAIDTLTKMRKARAAERKLAESKTAATQPVEVASQPEPPMPEQPPATPEACTHVMQEHSQTPEPFASPVEGIEPATPAAIAEPRPVPAFFDIIDAEKFLARAMSGKRPTREPAAHR